ncbi:hypothetical protein UPYG_G00355040 [Umbra pygmaea]|uniref:Uncharacterized protein n=1 Tax=Umbra pygmaea TaxID=75934 RepID=A0ABD0VWW9_UMBPY
MKQAQQEMALKTGPQLSTSPKSPPGWTAPKTKPRSKLSINPKDTTPGAEAASQKTTRKSGKSQTMADIISKSTLLHAGPPKRYLLVPNKKCLDGREEDESKVRRWSIESPTLSPSSTPQDMETPEGSKKTG